MIAIPGGWEAISHSGLCISLMRKLFSILSFIFGCLHFFIWCVYWVWPPFIFRFLAILLVTFEFFESMHLQMDPVLRLDLTGGFSLLFYCCFCFSFWFLWFFCVIQFYLWFWFQLKDLLPVLRPSDFLVPIFIVQKGRAKLGHDFTWLV